MHSPSLAVRAKACASRCNRKPGRPFALRVLQSNSREVRYLYLNLIFSSWLLLPPLWLPAFDNSVAVLGDNPVILAEKTCVVDNDRQIAPLIVQFRVSKLSQCPSALFFLGKLP